MNKTLNRLVRILILCGMAIGIGLLVFVFAQYLPMARRVMLDEGKPLWFTYAAGGLAVLCVAGAEYIALTLYRMMRTLDGDPFVTGNVRALRRMGFTALAVAGCGLMTLFLRPVPLAVVAAAPLIMCGLFSLVLAGVFQKAVDYKAEVDLTV